MLWLANLGLAAGATAEPPVVETPKKGGRTKPKRRYIVEVDGERIAASSISEAEAILAQARELAKESAPRDVRTSVRIKPPRVSIQTASGNKTTSAVLQRAVRDTQQAVNRIYRKAAEQIEVERELSVLIQQKLERDDEEEAITALLM